MGWVWCGWSGNCSWWGLWYKWSSDDNEPAVDGVAVSAIVRLSALPLLWKLDTLKLQTLLLWLLLLTSDRREENAEKEETYVASVWLSWRDDDADEAARSHVELIDALVCVFASISSSRSSAMSCSTWLSSAAEVTRLLLSWPETDNRVDWLRTGGGGGVLRAGFGDLGWLRYGVGGCWWWARLTFAIVRGVEGRDWCWKTQCRVGVDWCWFKRWCGWGADSYGSMWQDINARQRKTTWY